LLLGGVLCGQVKTNQRHNDSGQVGLPTLLCWKTPEPCGRVQMCGTAGEEEWRNTQARHIATAVPRPSQHRL
jgi:hypothetical protein